MTGGRAVGVTDADDYDVVVIGSGGAGLAAAVTAAQCGARVLVLESEQLAGGSTQLSAGMLTAAGTSVQQALGIDDDPGRMYQHYMDLNQWKVLPGPTRMFCERSGETVEWLLDLGVQIPAQTSSSAHVPGLTRAGVEDVWRGHVPKDQGLGLIETLIRAAHGLGVDIAFGSRVDDLVVEGGRVRGATVNGERVSAPAVVVASGGLGQDPDLVRTYLPDAALAGSSLFVVAAPGSRGDHIRFADRHGLALYGQGWGLLLVTAEFVTMHHWQSGFPPLSRVHVDTRGVRCMDEDAPYAVSPGIVNREGGHVWAVFDERARRELPEGFADWTPSRVLQEVDGGVVRRAETLDGLAAVLGMPAGNLSASVSRFNDAVRVGRDQDYLRHETLADKGVDFGSVDPVGEPPFYAVRMMGAELVCTHTGLRIDHRARVASTAGEPVPGLYAAGEAAGGVLGERYVGGGNSVAHALVLGRVAGGEAAGYVRGGGWRDRVGASASTSEQRDPA